MKLLDSTCSVIKRFAKIKVILPMFALFVIILVVMSRAPFGSEKFRELSGGIRTLDMTYGYHPDTVYGLFEKIGSTGLLIHKKFLSLDFLYAIVYMVLQSLLITALMKRAKLIERLGKLNLLPFLRSELDFAENGLLLFLIAEFPQRHNVIVLIASAITIVKLSINYSYIAIVFSLGALTTRKSIKTKVRSKNMKGMRQDL